MRLPPTPAGQSYGGALFGLFFGRWGGAEEPALAIPPFVAPEDGDAFVDTPKHAYYGQGKEYLEDAVHGISEIKPVRA